MTRFVHLTDLHLSCPNADGDDQSAVDLFATKSAAIRRVADLMADMDPAPDFVVFSGDLTDRGDRESYAALKGTLEAIEVPIVFALGNHDRREGFRQVFGPEVAPADDPADPLFHHARYGDLHVIALDSSVPGRVGGALDAAQAEKLEQALAAHPEAAKLIVCHHPPLLDRAGLLAWESLAGEDTERLARALEGHDIAALLCGHVHINRVLHWRGWPVIIPVGLHNRLNRLGSGELIVEEGTGIAVCDYRPGALDVAFQPIAPVPRELGRIGPEILRSFS